MKDLYQQIIERGRDALDALIGEAEGLHLEVKRKANPSKSKLEPTDRKNLSRAIGALGNADGGLFLFGVVADNTKLPEAITGFDVISNVAQVAAAIEGALPELINPPINDLSVAPILLEGDKGIVAVHVPQSQQRPHMSTAKNEHCYYRRTYDRTITMDHRMVKDAILAVREPRLKVIARVSHFSTKNDRSLFIHKLRLHLDLANPSEVTAKAPYLKTETNHNLPVDMGVMARDHRVLPDGLSRFPAFPDGYLFSGEQDNFASFNFFVAVDWHRVYSLSSRSLPFEYALPLIAEVGTVRNRFEISELIPDELGISCAFGAANAHFSTTRLALTKYDLCRLAIEAGAIKPEAMYWEAYRRGGNNPTR